MQQQIKSAITAAASAYLSEKGLPAAELSRQSGVNESYLSQMLAGKTATKAGQKEVVIADKYFITLADFVGYAWRKAYWQTVPTLQFQQIVSALENRKETGRAGMIIAATGHCKTYAVDRFCQRNPRHTFRVTVSSLYKLTHIVNELCELVGVDVSLQNAAFARSQNHHSMKLRYDKLVERLADIRQSGGCPIIILDEAENLSNVVLQAVKGLYDVLKDVCAIVLIGTDQIVRSMVRGTNKNSTGFPQLWRRYKAGMLTLTPIDPARDYPPFFEAMKVQDAGLCKLLCGICDNYGELADYLKPVLQEADERSVPLTEEFFRLYHNMPKSH